MPSEPGNGYDWGVLRFFVKKQAGTFYIVLWPAALTCIPNIYIYIYQLGISIVIPVMFIIKPDCLTQLYDSRYMYIIYYIKNNYMFRHFTLDIFRSRNNKLSKQLYWSCVGCIQWGGKRWSGYENLHVLCRVGGVGTWGFCCCMLFYINLDIAYNSRTPMYPHRPSYTTHDISYPLHHLTPHCTQPT